MPTRGWKPIVLLATLLLVLASAGAAGAAADSDLDGIPDAA